MTYYVSTGSGNATHDADGNLTYDPQVPRAVSPACKFTWDAENRMTEARNFSGVSQVKLGYDAYGRLVRREHTSPLATGAGRAKVELYAHVGGLRVAVYSGNTSTKAVTLIRAIAWGPDLSGTVGGAGGIGGLLSVRETSASTSSRKGLTMLLGHDAKGDVTSVWSADGAYLGGYVTQAFGQVAVLSGSAAYLSENQWRIASKPLEWLTGYSHWGRRWYSPFLGRWVSRDPIGETGGVNLYGACGNDPVTLIDPVGLLVTAVLDTKNNTLTITDNDTKESITAQAFTGGYVRVKDGAIISPGESPQTPAPLGTYNIVDNPNPSPQKSDWYGLFKQDILINDYCFDCLKERDGIRLHLGSLSHGCVTVSESQADAEKKWKKIREIINNTKKERIRFTKGRWFFTEEGETTKYGTLIIK